ncbi:MAG TPA: type 1 glutamine amidotransferase [Acidimicrobiales bacterium]|nr:type 1 glutamine amidotransferase [Acidimicrobiales bacterium]
MTVSPPAAGGGPGDLLPSGRWSIIQHVAYEGPGLIVEVLTAAGHPFRVIRVDQGDDLPGLDRVGGADGIGGLVVLGGPMSVHDGDRFPWLADERKLLAAAVEAGLPVLGVCLGAQQLAAALGAEVTTGDRAEIGLGSVVLTAAGRRDRVLGPEYGGLAGTDIPCVHWHQDTFSLPPDAVHLAATRAFPHQGFRVGARAYGFQFHVEVTSALADGWRAQLPDDVVLEAAGLSRVETTGRRILPRFVDLAAP